MALVSQKAVNVAVFVLLRLAVIPFGLYGAPKRRTWNSGRRQLPKRFVDESFSQANLSLSCQRDQFLVLTWIVSNGYDTGNRKTAVTNQDLLARPDFYQVSAETVLKLRNIDGFHTWP